MYLVYQNMAKGMAALLLLAFVAVGALGLPHFAMSMGHDGAMADCPFMAGTAALCSTDAFSHISAWQKTITSLPSQMDYGIMFLLLVVFRIVFSIWNRDLFSPPKVLQPAFVLSFENSALLMPPLFVQLFSAGILNSKAF